MEIFLTKEHRDKLIKARAYLCDIQDPVQGGLNSTSEEYQKITEVLALIEKLLGCE